MPRLTAKQRKIRELRNIIATRESAAMLRDLLSEDESEEDDLDTYWLTELDRVQERRYIARPSCYRRHKNRWMKLLNDSIHTSDADFLKHFRLKRSEFIRLASLVENDAVFKPKGEKPLRGGAMLHLMVLLKFIGAYGNGNTPSDITKFLGLARGSFYNYLDREIIAVLRLEDAVITWPDSEERHTIARRIKDKYGFVNCVGITDGTLLPLSAKPRHNGEDYYSRKSSYAVNALITCDDVARVRNIVVGWPGSVHDNRVWSNSPMAQHPNQHFKHNEYLLGDSAFQVSNIMVPAYKKPPMADLHPDCRYFTTS